MAITAAAVIVAAVPALAETYTLVLKDHSFEPRTLEVPAGQKFTLIVKNQDGTPAEFESDDFKREKIIPGNSEAKINVGPLKPGSYSFFDEFHQDKANGTLIVK